MYKKLENSDPANHKQYFNELIRDLDILCRDLKSIKMMVRGSLVEDLANPKYAKSSADVHQGHLQATYYTSYLKIKECFESLVSQARNRGYDRLTLPSKAKIELTMDKFGVSRDRAISIIILIDACDPIKKLLVEFDVCKITIKAYDSAEDSNDA